MKQRNFYQLPKNWRKIKRSIERDLHKANIDYNKVSKDLLSNGSMELYIRVSHLKKELEKLQKSIRHRYENSWVDHKVINLGKPSPVKISYCGCYGEDGYGLNVERRRLNTAYVNDESNYTECCIHCYLDRHDYYEELWEEYYSGRL